MFRAARARWDYRRGRDHDLYPDHDRYGYTPREVSRYSDGGADQRNYHGDVASLGISLCSG